MAPRKALMQPEQATKRYFIVNPAGAIHEVPRDLAAKRLREIGYRMATPAEVAKYNEANGNQHFKRPICAPFSTDPDAEPELE